MNYEMAETEDPTCCARSPDFGAALPRCAWTRAARKSSRRKTKRKRRIH